MGDWFQSIVDPETTEADAPAAADRVLRWLIDEQIVVGDRTDCTLGDGGYAPGRAYVKATGSSDPYLLATRTNGLEVVSTRTVFYSGGLGYELKIVCLSCGGRFEPPEGPWGDAVGEWYHRRGAGMLACPGCGAARPVTEWPHEPAFGFGNVGFTFWNWPNLTGEFVAAVGRQLRHRVFVVVGKV